MKYIFSNSLKHDAELIRENTSIIELIENEFDIPPLLSKKVLIYFGWKSEYFAKALGRTYFRDIPDHKLDITNEFQEIFMEEEIDDYDFYIYLSNDVFKDEDKIFKTFTVAHELQHIMQYYYDRCHFLMGRVLFFHLLINERENMPFKLLPYEYDARKKAKQVCCSLFTEDQVNLFLRHRAQALNAFDKEEYEFLDGIRIKEKYDMVEEISMLWSKNKDSIFHEVAKMEGKTQAAFPENKLHSCFDYLVATCPGIDK